MLTKRLTPIIAEAVVAAVLFARADLHADLISGNLSFSGEATFDTGSAATATTVTAWTNVLAQAPSDTFASGPYAVSNNAPVTFGSWNFNLTTPITCFWNLGGFKCELLTSYIVTQDGTPGHNGFVYVNGTGVISGNGFTPTLCAWYFSASDPAIDPSGPWWTFEASIHCFNTNGEPVLASTTISNTIVLNWSDPTFALQSAPMTDCMFTNIPGATSPYTNSITCMQQFFRLMQP